MLIWQFVKETILSLCLSLILSLHHIFLVSIEENAIYDCSRAAQQKKISHWFFKRCASIAHGCFKSYRQLAQMVFISRYLHVFILKYALLLPYTWTRHKLYAWCFMCCNVMSYGYQCWIINFFMIAFASDAATNYISCEYSYKYCILACSFLVHHIYIVTAVIMVVVRCERLLLLL